MLPRCGTDEDQGLGQWLWEVERTLSWLHQFRRLRVRYDRSAEIHQVSYHRMYPQLLATSAWIILLLGALSRQNRRF